MLASSFCTLYLKNGIFNIKRARRQGKLFWNSRLNNLIMILHFPWVWLVWKAMHFLLFTMATWSGHAAEPRIVLEWFRSTPKISRAIQRTYTVIVHIRRHRVYVQRKLGAYNLNLASNKLEINETTARSPLNILVWVQQDNKLELSRFNL
mgnify:CR=1 FL=1